MILHPPFQISARCYYALWGTLADWDDRFWCLYAVISKQPRHEQPRP